MIESCAVGCGNILNEAVFKNYFSTLFADDAEAIIGPSGVCAPAEPTIWTLY